MSHRALIIAAHPDDELLGCGGTIAKLAKAGTAFKVVFIGEGSTARFNDPKDVNAISAIKVRNDNAVRALASLGVTDIDFGNAPCGRFDQFSLLEINKQIEDSIRAFEPDLVFTHSNTDANNDHRIVHAATLIATRPVPNYNVKTVLCYEVLSSSEWRFSEVFSPHFFVSLEEEHVTEKWNALALYENEMRDYPFPRSREGVFTLAKYRGMQTGHAYAEAFEVVRHEL